METKNLIKEIQEIIENHGSIHCYEDVIVSCLPSNQNYL